VHLIKRKTVTANVSLTVQSTSSGRKTRVALDLSTKCRTEWCLRCKW